MIKHLEVCSILEVHLLNIFFTLNTCFLGQSAANVRDIKMTAVQQFHYGTSVIIRFCLYTPAQKL